LIYSDLKPHRLERALTQEHLAHDLGVTRQTIIAIETGKYNPSLELALRIADYFGCHVEDIFHLETKGGGDDE